MKFVLASLLLASSAFGAGLTGVDVAEYQKLIASHKGKVVLVNFWATYCAPCRAEMPELVKMEARLKAKGLVLLTVTADEAEQEEDAARFLDHVKVPSPRYIRKAKDETAFINSIEPKWKGQLPATFIYDKTGKKVRSILSSLNAKELKELEASLLKLL